MSAKPATAIATAAAMAIPVPGPGSSNLTDMFYHRIILINSYLKRGLLAKL